MNNELYRIIRKSCIDVEIEPNFDYCRNITYYL